MASSSLWTSLAESRGLNVPAARYDDEILSVNWNPAIGLLRLSLHGAETPRRRQLPPDLATADVDAFLERVYTLAA